jgi:PAS domain S-box-containing protein
VDEPGRAPSCQDLVAERLLRSVIEALDGALAIVGRDGTVLDANGRWPGTVGSDFFEWCRTTGDLQPLLGDVATAVRDLIGTDPAEWADQPVAVKGQIGAEGERRWVVLRVHPIRDHQLARAVVTLIDITDGMRTQEHLRRATEQAQRLALVARATDNAVVITEPDGTIEWVNDPFVAQTGYRFEEALGRRRTDLVDAGCQELAEFRDLLAQVELGRGADGEFPLLSRTGRPYWVSMEVRPVRENGQITHLVWIEQDVTARRDTERRLRQAMDDAEQLAAALTQEKTLLTGVISAIPQLVYWKDDSGRYAGCNRAYLVLLGLDPERDLPGGASEPAAPDDAVRVALDTLESQVLRSGQPVLDHTVDVPDGSGRVRTMLLSVLPLDLNAPGTARTRGVIGVGADITHARDLERQLAQANRLESIGQLAAGIAHEINTPIQFVTDNTQFVSESVAEMLTALAEVKTIVGQDELTSADLRARARAAVGDLELEFLQAEVPGALRDNRDGLDRVAQIVRAMKDYAHPGHSRSDVDVNRAVESTVQVCRNEWKYVAEVELDLDPHAGLVPAYEGELKQVILNLVVNAAQAIGDDPRRSPGSGLGRIVVTTRRAGAELMIRISDNGPGMPPEVRDRAFHPFFTTKEVGKGTGQGLSLAHGVIVTKHQGRIELDTAPGQGATFTVHLPLERREAEPVAGDGAVRNGVPG